MSLRTWQVPDVSIQQVRPPTDFGSSLTINEAQQATFLFNTMKMSSNHSKYLSYLSSKFRNINRTDNYGAAFILYWEILNYVFAMI